MSGWRSFLRANRLVARRAASHRQHALRARVAHAATCGACRSRPAESTEAILSGPFPEYDARISPTASGWPMFPRRLAARRFMFGRCRASRGVSWPPTTAAASLSGGAMDASCSTSISKGSLRGRSVGRGERTLGAAALSSVPLIGAGHWGTQYDVSPDGQRVYFSTRLRRRGRATSMLRWAGGRSCGSVSWTRLSSPSEHSRGTSSTQKQNQ